MARMDLRVRAFAWLFAHTPGGSVDTMTPEQIDLAHREGRLKSLMGG